MRFRGKSSSASCRAGAYPGGPVAALEGGSPVSPAMPGPARRPGGDVDAGSPALRPCSVHRRRGLGSCSGCGGAPFILPDLPDLPDSLRFPPAGCRPRRPAGCRPRRSQPGVLGYLPWPSPPCRGFPGLITGGPAHAGGAGDFPERCTVVVVIMHEPVLRRSHEIQPVPGLRRR